MIDNFAKTMQKTKIYTYIEGKMSKKIGILTMYATSKNYGGNLQAYALVEVLRKLGQDAEQIDYDMNAGVKIKSNKDKFRQLAGKSLVFVVKKLSNAVRVRINGLVKKCKYATIYKKYCKEYENGKVVRDNEIEKFNRKTPHSVKQYENNNVNEAQDYDLYITGSDQVWNMRWYRAAFFLDFVKGKDKISYAASMATDNITEEEQNLIAKHLRDFNGVSVREKNDLRLLSGIDCVTPQLTLDPTLLLSREDWDKITADRMIDQEYVFCYYLGVDKENRRLAKQFAKKHKLKLVTVPFINGLNCADCGFGDERLYVGVEQFLSLIKYAKYVFTDSFHAVVFSNIYQRQYFVFNRSSKGEMNSRIYNVTELFENPERFCDTKEKESLQYIETLEPINYNRDFEKYDILKEQSIKFLLDNLGEPIK